jgi:hypothetical protein
MQPPFNALGDELEGVNDPPGMMQQQQQGGQNDLSQMSRKSCSR